MDIIFSWIYIEKNVVFLLNIFIHLRGSDLRFGSSFNKVLIKLPNRWTTEYINF